MKGQNNYSNLNKENIVIDICEEIKQTRDGEPDQFILVITTK